MLKIDTEGFEPHVLESIRPLWPQLGDVLTEVQPHAWKFHNLTADAALATFRELITLKQYVVVTLPHTTLEQRKLGTWNVTAASHLDVCTLPVHRGVPHTIVPTVGLETAEVLDVDGFEAFVRNILRRPRLGLFHEFWLTSAAHCPRRME